MAIVKMNKLSVIGIDSAKSKLMDDLMDLGVVELNAQEGKMTDEQWSCLVQKDGNEVEASKIEAEIARVSIVLETLGKYGSGKKPLFKTRRTVSRTEFEDTLRRRISIEKNVKEILTLNDELNELKTAENKIETNRLSLVPWENYDAPLELSETKSVSVMIGVVPSVADTEKLRADVEAKTMQSVVNLIGSDADQHYLSVLCLKQDFDDVIEILKQYGFNRSSFKDVSGSASENISLFQTQLEEMEQKRIAVEKQIGGKESLKGEIEFLHDNLIMERDHERIKSKLLTTKRAFYLDGWMPRHCTEAVEKLLKENECYYEVEEPAKDEETPVLLHNGPGSYPFEAITNLYALPHSKSVDPTAFFSFFYFLFFGLMLSDAVYGIVITVACIVILKKYHLEGMPHKLIKMFLYCGISTIFWGAMFGGWMGDIVTVAGRNLFGMDIAIQPLWFNPVADPMKLLIFSLILGAIHLFLGMGLKAYMMAKDGDAIGAFCDVGLWYILFAGLALFGLGANLSPIMPEVGKWMAIIGAVGIVLTGGRDKKGFGKVTGGFGAIYGITSYLADILSYSRLLALGLATGVIAQVVNTMGGLAGGGVVGGLVLIVVCLFGHTFNLAINALGSFVHSSRLQYVEFFGKFFISGGEAFRPFFKKTQYIEIVREEN